MISDHYLQKTMGHRKLGRHKSRLLFPVCRMMAYMMFLTVTWVPCTLSEETCASDVLHERVAYFCRAEESTTIKASRK